MTKAASGTGGAVMTYAPRFSDFADVQAALSGSDRNIADEMMR